MRRSRSLPVRNVEVNPFYSSRAVEECMLHAARPSHLPNVSSVDGSLLAIRTGMPSPPQCPPSELTGKGRGTGSVEPQRSTECFNGQRTEVRMPAEVGHQTEGRMPTVTGHATMGSGYGNEQPQQQGNEDSETLQRALERDLVELLRQQNSKLMDELSYLRGQLDRRSGVTSSPWSAVDVSVSETAEGPPASQPFLEPRVEETHRVGRDGSRTPRARVRESAASPQRGNRNSFKFTLNGTRVPDHPPPAENVPPVPPIPSFPEPPVDISMYESFDVPPRGRNGNVQWKPQEECHGAVSAREAKQIWMEREIRSLQGALNRLEIPPSFRHSPYWNDRFQGLPESCKPTSSADHGGDREQARAPDGWLLGEHRDRVRAQHGAVLGNPRDGDRASPEQAHGVHREEDRAWHGSLHAPGSQHPANREDDRAGLSHGVYGDDRAGAGQHGLLDNWYGRFCDLPGHGGQDRVPNTWAGGSYPGTLSQALPQVDLGRNTTAPWGDTMGTTANSKLDLPDLPSTASPLQFGDWLHLIGSTMRDISGVASRWWDLTSREATCYYQRWKESTPLQRVQIEVRPPDELNDPRYHRTEQRGVQMLLKAVPSTEQQALIAERALNATSIVYRLMIRFQPGGAGKNRSCCNISLRSPRWIASRKWPMFCGHGDAILEELLRWVQLYQMAFCC